ncbi:CHASE domain-containing protein [Actibacterium sp. D379-3]
MTSFSWYGVRILVDRENAHEFDDQADEITNAISDRLVSYEQVLWGGVGFLNATGQMDRTMWRDYVASLKVEEQWPGMQGMGLSVPVLPSDKAAHIAAIREEGFPDYTIRPEGKRDAYSAIIFLEPFDWRNQRAFGYDMWSNPMRRAAMTRARDTGLAARSGIITLVQETNKDVQRGFLTYVPVYQKNMPLKDATDRRRAFIGWVYSPFRMGDFMSGILHDELSHRAAHISYEIFDGTEIAPDALLYASHDMATETTGGESPAMTKVRTIGLQGHDWTVRFAATGIGQGWLLATFPWMVAAAGLCLTGCATYMVASLAKFGQRAGRLVKARTKNLEEEKRIAQAAREQAEAANQELEFLQKYLNEHAIVSEIGLDGKIIAVNDKLCEVTGFTREELIGQSHELLHAPGEIQAFFDEISSAIESGKPWRGEIRNMKKDGGFFWGLETVVPYLDRDGNPVKYVGIRTDITLQKEMESAERKAADHKISQLKSSLDLDRDEIFMCRADNLQFIYLNKAALKSLGRTEAECLGKTPADIDPRFDSEMFRMQSVPLVTGSQNALTFERSTGAPTPIEVTVQLIKPEGEVPHFVAIVRDISERKKGEKAKSEFLATVSHELRTPLTSIRGALGLVQAGTAGPLPEKAQSLLQVAYRNSERLSALVNDILDFEKLESGKMEMAMSRMDIAHVLRSSVQANETYADKFQVRFVTEGDDEPIFVIGNESRLMQVMDNLLSNAVKFSPVGGTVKVALVRGASSAQIFVTDSGAGIPEAAQPFIFDKFTQADSSDTRHSEGTGLGLSIAKLIVDQHGGAIGFTSKPGQQTTFHFNIPYVAAEGRPMALG